MYDFQNPGDKKNFNAQGLNAIFLSKVPNCKDTKIKHFENLGPGVYEKEFSSVNASGIIGGHKRSNSDSGINESEMNASSMTNANKTNQNFMSTTKREKDFWINRIDTPYTHPTSMLNPGPGKYNHEKKKDDIKTRILMEETVHVPFGSSEERPCMRKPVPKQPVPGPGTYIDINNPLNSSVSKPLLKFSSDRTFAEAHGIKLGAFGSNTKRFEKGVFDGKHGPGPGHYDYTIDRTIEDDTKKIEKARAGNASPAPTGPVTSQIGGIMNSSAVHPVSAPNLGI